jgi:uncharacterized protein YpmB
MIKKGLFLLLLICFLFIWQSVSIYLEVVSDKNRGMQKGIERIQKETNLTIQTLERFHGDQLYTIYLGKDEEEQLYYVLIDNQSKLQKLALQEISLTKSDVTNLVHSRFTNITKVIRIIPGYTDDQFTWEVLVQDENDHLQYIYFTMRDGIFQKRYILSK